MKPYKKTPDDIARAIRRRDHEAFKKAFEMWFEKMTLFGEYFLYAREEAEDVAQEVFVELWENADKLPEIANLQGYLFTEVKNKCLNRLKHLRVEDNYKRWLAEAQEYAEIPDTEIDEEQVRQVYAAIEELPEQARHIFKQCALEGKKYKEVAAELGVSVNTVNTQMSRSFKYIREKLGITLLLFIYHII